MEIGTLLGMIGGLGLVVLSISMKASILNFIDLPSIFIVFGGTIAATLNSFSLKSVINSQRTMIKLFFVHRIDVAATIREMVTISNMAKKQGKLALEKYKTNNEFTQKGLQLVADGMKGATLQALLELEMHSIDERHTEGQLILEKMGDLSPAWGMVGTLIGLVIMLLSLDDPSSIGPAMAVALLTTFYGVLWANLILLPSATKLEQRTKRELQEMKIIIEALVSISNNENPRLLTERLLGFLKASERAIILGEDKVAQAPPAKG